MLDVLADSDDPLVDINEKVSPGPVTLPGSSLGRKEASNVGELRFPEFKVRVPSSSRQQHRT